MRPEEKRLLKVPFEESLRKRIIKLTNPPYNVKKGELVKKAAVTHQTFLNFMNNIKDTKIKSLDAINTVVCRLEESKGIRKGL